MTEVELEVSAIPGTMYAWCPDLNGPNRFRVVEPCRVFADHGGRVALGPMLDNAIAERCDTVLVHGLHDERNSEAWADLAAAGGHRLIMDIDDLMWIPDHSPFARHYDPANLDRLRANMNRAHVVTTTTDELAQRIRDWTGHPNIHVVPNTVPQWLTEHVMPRRDHPTVGWQGSPSHIPDLASTGRALAKFASDCPDWRIRLYGVQALSDPHPAFELVEWMPLDDYWRTASFDVGIGPLRDTPFNRAKSALRAVEYAALGIVAVLPDLPTYRGWVEDGVTGILVQSNRTLRGELRSLAKSAVTRIRMAAAARRRAAHWTTEANIGRWVAAWNSV